MKLQGLFPNTAFDTFGQNAAEPQLRKATNSRAIWSFSKQGAGAFWAQWGKDGIWKQPLNGGITLRNQTETDGVLDLKSPPPRAWIDETLRFDQPERLGAILPTVIMGLDPPPDILADMPEFGMFPGDHDAVLAERILAGISHRFYPGNNQFNSYAHGAWAMAVLGRDQQAWEFILNIGPHTEQIKMPIGVLRMFLFLALRLGKTADAAQAWGALMKWYNTDLDHTDMQLHEIYLSQAESSVTPLEASAR